MAFVPWNDRLDSTLGFPTSQMVAGFPHVQAWHDALVNKASWKKAMELRVHLMMEQGLNSIEEKYEDGIAATSSSLWNMIPQSITVFLQYWNELSMSARHNSYSTIPERMIDTCLMELT